MLSQVLAHWLPRIGLARPPRPGGCTLHVGRRQGPRPDGTGNTTIYQAAAAVPHANSEWATYGLACQLRVMAVAAGATPDWTTLAVTGPTEVAGAQDRARFEWTASVTVHGAGVFDIPDPDAFPPARTAADATHPFQMDSSLR